MTFPEPVLGLLSPDFVYVYMNRIETNYPVCRLYHYCVVYQPNLFRRNCLSAILLETRGVVLIPKMLLKSLHRFLR